MRNAFRVDANVRVAPLPWGLSLAAFLVASAVACEGQVEPSGISPSPVGAPGNQVPTGTNLSTGGATGNGAANSASAPGAGGSDSGIGNTNGGAAGTANAGAGSSTGLGTGLTPTATGTGNGNAGGGLPCDVQTLLMNRCQTCHGATPVAGVPSSLVTYQNLTGPSKSDPTKTLAVMAVSRMQNTTLPMPPRPGTPATAAETSMLQAWIAAGYPTGSCGGPVGAGGGQDGGTSNGGAPDAGPATGGLDAGIVGVGDPFALPSTCTSNKTWTQGTNGSGSMEPGMACINCHNRGGEAPRFAIAGTVYPTAHEPDLCNGANGSNGAQIVITGADGKSVTLTPNGVGNFSSNAAVAMPYQAKIMYMGRERLMIAAQTSGDCNSCHTQMGATMAPGRLLLP